jgi:hypothetical protein
MSDGFNLLAHPETPQKTHRCRCQAVSADLFPGKPLPVAKQNPMPKGGEFHGGDATAGTASDNNHVPVAVGQVFNR